MKLAGKWQERVLKARERFRRGVLAKGLKYTATKEDIERARGRLLDMTLKLAKERFGPGK